MFKKAIIALSFIASTAKAQVVPGKILLNPLHPKAGQSLQVTYTPVKDDTNAKIPIKVLVYQYTNYQWTVDTLSMVSKKKALAAKIILDHNSAFLALKFDQPAGADHNGSQGYSWTVSSNKGQRLPGGALAQGLLHMPRESGGIPGYFEQPHKPSADTLQSLLAEEQHIKGSSPSRYAKTYIAWQRIIKGTQFKSEAPALLERLLAGKGLSDQDSAEIFRVYKFDLKDEAHAASIKKEIIQHHPQGDFARLDAYQQIQKPSDNKEIIAKSEKFLTDFPISKQRKNSPEQEYIYYGVYRTLATAYFQEGKFDELIRLSRSWDFKTENEVYRWNIDRGYLLKTIPLATIQPVADSLANDLLTKVNDGSYRVDFATPAERTANAVKQMDDRVRMQIAIHYALNQNQTALDYFKKLSPGKEFSNAETNEIHVDLLDRTAQKQAVQTLIEQSVKSNAVTPKMFTRLKEIYTDKNKSSEGYEQYLASLKSSKEITDLTAEVKKNMINQDIVPFALEDLNGNLVRSSDWDGKIIVIDFWATWCRPCISAFPGMQMLVDKYAKDPKVDFYFVGTMQFGDYKQKVKNFIQREGWRFKALHDGINKKTGAQDAVFSTLAPIFHSSGIPRKIIIKDGVIRYTTEGYSGSPSQLVDELSYAIEILKSEK